MSSSATEAPLINPSYKSRGADNYQQVPHQETFSASDVDLLVRLVLAGEWYNVEFYFNFLISHYQNFMKISSDRCNINQTAKIINSLYDLLVNIKVQQYFEALER